MDSYTPNIHRVIEVVTHSQKQAADIHLHPDRYLASTGIILKDARGKDYTTQVDRLIEKLQRELLAKEFPQIGFIGEETGSSQNTRFFWIVDPTDGTAVYATGGEYYSNSIALADRETERVLFGSVYQPHTEKQFLRAEGDAWIVEPIVTRDNNVRTIERKPIHSSSKSLPELMGCAYGTSRFYPDAPGLKEKLELVFGKVEFPELKRSYGMINAKPASGSTSLFCCDIADGKRHFIALYFQKAWDLAVGALFARDAGCIVECGSSSQPISGGNLERTIATCTQDTLTNVGVYANQDVRDIVLQRLQY